jgi:hypothetical protein
MDFKKFESILNERISTAKKAFEEQEIKRKSTIIYLYEQTMKILDSEIRESVDLFNVILNEKCNDLNLLVYYGSSCESKFISEKERQITIIFDSLVNSETRLTKDLKSCDFITFKIAQEYKKEDSSFSYYFIAEYQFSSGHSSYEKNEFKTIFDDVDQNKILNNLKEFFDEFIKNYLSKSQNLGYRTKK